MTQLYIAIILYLIAVATIFYVRIRDRYDFLDSIVAVLGTLALGKATYYACNVWRGTEVTAIDPLLVMILGITAYLYLFITFRKS